ncbi:hypothetical protein CEP51_016596 [Fusarium floridanum]|nr:hypothetical protein CEP51_016596 [Fusarium floridanum]
MLDIDPAGDGGEGGEDDGIPSGDLISSEAARMNGPGSVQPAQPSMSPQAAENARTLDWRPQNHEGLRENAALNLSDASETESGVHPLPAATAFRRLLAPGSALEMGENISQRGAMPASGVRGAHLPKDYENGNSCEDLVSSEAAVAASPINDDEDEDEYNDEDDSEDGSEDGYRSLPLAVEAAVSGKAAVRGAHRQPGISRQRRRQRQRKGQCEDEARPNYPAHSVAERQSLPTSSLGKDSSLSNVSNDPAPIRRKRDQPRSEEGEDERIAKRQRTHHGQQAIEIVQDQGQSQEICLDSPAITTPQNEPSSVHSPSSRSLNASLDAESTRDDDDRVLSGAFISSEPTTVAPGPRGSDVHAHDDGDAVYDTHQQPDPPSQREEQRHQQQQDTFKQQDIATEAMAKVRDKFEEIDERIKGAEVLQIKAEEKEKVIKNKIEFEGIWQQNLKALVEESVEKVRKFEEELKNCQEEKQSAARELKEGRQSKSDLAQKIEDILPRDGGK